MSSVVPSHIANASNSDIFSCLACRLILTSSLLQKEHFKSDWHRYNLKRRIAQLSTIPLSEFLEKADSQQIKMSFELESNEIFRCLPCKKQFSSKNQLQNHYSAKKHRSHSLMDKSLDTSTSSLQNKKKTSDSMETSISLTSTQCLFCSLVALSSELHVDHMYTQHGFFLPFYESLINSDELLSYLAEKVGKYRICFICGPNKYFSSVQAVMHHMVSKSHTQIDLSDIEAFYEEFGEYYDFTVDASSELEFSNDDSKMISYDEDMSLILPSGHSIGHRAFKYVYKQNLKPHNTAIVVKTGPSIHYSQQIRMLRDKSKYCRDKHYNSMKLGVKANKLQTYFTPQY